MCMFMGFAGYGIGGKSRYDHGTYIYYVFDMIMNILYMYIMLCVGLITFVLLVLFVPLLLLYSLYT